jgi:hypothetical protein
MWQAFCFEKFVYAARFKSWTLDRRLSMQKKQLLSVTIWQNLGKWNHFGYRTDVGTQTVNFIGCHQ